jgi:hypothetical protein
MVRSAATVESTPPGPAPAAAAADARRLADTAVTFAPLLAALPLVVLLVAVVARHPAIVAGGDRAVTNLEVRDLLAGRQSLGAYSRFGWHHPGPAFLIPLAVIDVLFGHVPWTLDAGMLVAGAVTAELVVVITRRAAGPAAALATAGLVALYVRAVGPAVFRTPWNPFAVLLPLVLLVVLCAWAAAGSPAALAAAVLTATVVVQTHVSVGPLTLVVLACTGALVHRQRRARPGPAGPLWWRQPAVWVPLAATVALWVPPVAQEVRGSDPNLTALVRFFSSPHPGHSLSTSVAAVGSRLALFPFGGSHRFLTAAASGVPWHRAAADGAVIALSLLIGLAVAVVAHRRDAPFARALGVFTVAMLPASVLAVHTAEGPLDGYLVGWATVIPLAGWIGVAALLPRRGIRAAVLVALVGGVAATVAAVGAPSAAGEDSPAVTAAWTELVAALGGRRPGPVLLQTTATAAWPVQAGLALELEEHGWQARVDDRWVFMFGPWRRITGDEPVVVTLSPVRGSQDVSVRVTEPLSAAELRQAAAGLASRLAPAATSRR